MTRERPNRIFPCVKVGRALRCAPLLPRRRRILSYAHNKTVRGFTLIELMVVISIIAIISAVMVGEMSGTVQDALLRGTGRQLTDTFHYASSQAIAHNRMHVVHFNQEDGRYQIETRQHGRFAPSKEGAGNGGSIDSRIHYEVRDQEQEESLLLQTIAFYPDGTADAREVVLRDRDGFGLALRVNPVTAAVDVVELERQ